MQYCPKKSREFDELVKELGGDELQRKLWILSLFGEQHPSGHWGTNLKNELCQQAFISRGKQAKF